MMSPLCSVEAPFPLSEARSEVARFLIPIPNIEDRYDRSAASCPDVRAVMETWHVGNIFVVRERLPCTMTCFYSLETALLPSFGTSSGHLVVRSDSMCDHCARDMNSVSRSIPPILRRLVINLFPIRCNQYLHLTSFSVSVT